MTKVSSGKLVNGELLLENTEEINFNNIESSDPIAFYFGGRDAKSGKKLPPKNSQEYKQLASEYIRGFNLIKNKK